MVKDIGIVNILMELRNLDKFAAEEWQKRGLMPSSTEKRVVMNEIINDTIDQLLQTIEISYSDSNIRTIMTNMLFGIDESDFDTEEMEFLCERFETLAQCMNVAFHEQLNKFLYGDLAEFL